MSLLSRLIDSPFMPKARSWLVVALASLMLFSLVMVASASIPFAMGREDFATLKFFWSQLAYILIACLGGYLVYQIPLKQYHDFDSLVAVYITVVLLLVATLVFGHSINGSKRWLNVFGFSFQPAEFAKMLMVLIISEYMKRRASEVRNLNFLVNFTRTMVWYAPVMVLLYFQPDFGSIVVIGATIFVLFFVGGVPYLQYFSLLLVGLLIGAFGLMSASYRHARVMSFLNPFDDVLGSDYQLARSLVAFGRGEWFGVGYGNSIQKLEHLPEAHTDFLLAITGEEFGFVGVLFVIALELVILFAIMRISFNSLKRRQLHLSYIAFGFGVLIFGQVVINAGMNMGVLPTKGLTMPFFSYGGSAMLFSVIMVAIVLKIDKESVFIAQKGENRNY